MLLTREDIIAVKDITVETVNVPEWGGDVFIRVLNGRELDEFQLRYRDGIERNDFRARLASLVLCDAEGKRIFADSDIPMLAEKSGKALDRLVEPALRINCMSDDSHEELVKN